MNVWVGGGCGYVGLAHGQQVAFVTDTWRKTGMLIQSDILGHSWSRVSASRWQQLPRNPIRNVTVTAWTTHLSPTFLIRRRGVQSPAKANPRLSLCQLWLAALFDAGKSLVNSVP